MQGLFARKALLPSGWADNVRLVVDGGHIQTVDKATDAAGGDLEVGIVIPGLANAHSHAFQRALAGHTEQRGPSDKDNFWTWRNRMYALAGKIDAQRLTAIARQAYTEMLSSGYTSVAEFHYLHAEPAEDAPQDSMLQAISQAAADSGIRLTYVPILYERGGFDEPLPNRRQQRFARSLDEFLAHYERARSLADDDTRVGIGAHSLRAVFPESLAKIAEVGQLHKVPIHIHIAEQQREVDQCLDVLGRRPVRWLLENCSLDENWCLVHATHMDLEETESLARSGAVVCLCPSTEANLGDGFFRLRDWLQNGGKIAIGSDSHVSINPFEELRWLEYGQRLLAEQRNIAAIARPNTGRNLFEAAASGGALATGQPGGVLQTGANADLVVLDDDSPMLLGHGDDSILDALVFSGFSLPIDRVMAKGVWQVVDGTHRNEQSARDDYARVVSDIGTQGDIAT
jgi:formimidoylglutamate deiminase